MRRLFEERCDARKVPHLLLRTSPRITNGEEYKADARACQMNDTKELPTMFLMLTVVKIGPVLFVCWRGNEDWQTIANTEDFIKVCLWV